MIADNNPCENQLKVISDINLSVMSYDYTDFIETYRYVKDNVSPLLSKITAPNSILTKLLNNINDACSMYDEPYEETSDDVSDYEYNLSAEDKLLMDKALEEPIMINYKISETLYKEKEEKEEKDTNLLFNNITINDITDEEVENIWRS